MPSSAARYSLTVGLATVLLAAPASASPIIERLMAVVAGEILTLTDVNAAIGLGLVNTAGAADPMAAALDQLIDRALMLGEVDRFAPPDPAPAEIDARVRQLRARFPSEEAFERGLDAYGLTRERLRGIARDDLRLFAYLDQRFPSIPAGEEDVGRYYREHAQEFTRDGALLPLAEVASDIRRRIEAERRVELLNEWTRGLRLRAEVSVLYFPGT
jgi:peptidyl-prolyl cis-trans isomerase C